jgi:hypothetical protein
MHFGQGTPKVWYAGPITHDTAIHERIDHKYDTRNIFKGILKLVVTAGHHERRLTGRD